MKHIDESIIGRKGTPLQDWHTGDLVYMNINGPNRPGCRDYVWIYLDKFEAKRRIDEFDSNHRLQGAYSGRKIRICTTKSGCNPV